MEDSPKSMIYLSVNAEDYLSPLGHGHERICRSVSPSLSTHSLNDDVSKFKSSSRSKSLLSLNRSVKTSNLSLNKLYKSNENLCFGMAKKKLNRRSYNDEVYRPRANTEPTTISEENPQQQPSRLVVPIIIQPDSEPESEDTQSVKPLGRRRSREGGGTALSSLIEQTLLVTTASMGFRGNDERRLSQQSSKSVNDDNVRRRFSRSTSSVSTLAAAANDTASMAPLQSHAEAQSVTCLNTLDKDTTANCTPQHLLEEDKRQYYRTVSTPYSSTSATSTTATQSDYYSSVNSSSPNESYQSLSTLRSNHKGDIRTLKQSSSNTLNQLVPVASSASLYSISPSRSSNSSNTAKHEQSAAAAATAAAATTPPEKEKKRKEVSSSRVKKFHRHFSQVSKDEKLINYFSCALVSDILLQGHLYITDEHFAFYSNVFGYVTKVVIPTSSVTKISKEKTAKIIPNAVGVATAEERHVFGSFISREAAFRLMCSVCPPLAPAEIIAKLPVDIVDISEEYSIEDDSSCSISGNESPPQGSALAAKQGGEQAEQMLMRRNVGDSKSMAGNEKQRHSDIPINAKNANSAFAHHPNAGIRASAPPSARHTSNNSSNSASPSKVLLALNPSINASMLSTPTTGAAASAATNLTMIIAGTASSTTSTASASSTATPSTSSSPTTVMAPPKSAAQAAADSFRALSKNALLRVKFPTELHVVYLGVLLTMVLALFSVFLLYRILDIEAKTTSYRSSVDFNWRSGNDEDIFAEALRWQKELQSKSTEEAQNILTTNLEQIAKVRRSLETLSMLIHDRSSAYANRDDSD